MSVNSVDKLNAFSHGMHVLKTSCVSEGKFLSDEKKSILPSDIHRAKCSPTKGNIIVSRMNTPLLVGELGYVPADMEDAFLPDRLWLMKFKNDESVDSHRLSRLLSSSTFSKKIKESATGTSGSMKNISKDSFLAILVPKPVFKEQKKIAIALSDADALIVGLEQLIAKKQAIKTATMQQLLTGRTRLPQFALRPDCTPKGYKSSELGQIPEDWEVKILRDMLAESPKYGINAPAVELSRDTPAYIRITDINSDGYYRPTEKVGVRSIFSEQYILHVNDIVLARTGASVGKSYLYNVDDGQLVYAGFLIKISPLQKILNSSYLFQFMKTKKYWDWVLVNSMRSGQPGINGAEFASMLIPTPSINEQTAIATILSDMDSELTALEQKLAKSRDLKQGMMQQLLTGRIRLPLPQET